MAASLVERAAWTVTLSVAQLAGKGALHSWYLGSLFTVELAKHMSPAREATKCLGTGKGSALLNNGGTTYQV